MIEVKNIWKVFRLYHNPKNRLKEIIFRRPYSTAFTALKDISLSVREGETLGIIGENGAGKSTLLKILAGILMPSRGQVSIDGNITGILELGTGFNPELTGVRNIYMNGLLLGMSKEEIDSKLESIIDFTELGTFIDEPIKTYSSGMLMRLAFSVSIHAEPRAFVVDEALSVGDAYFQQKCMNRMKRFKERGGSIVFVSHDMNAVKVLCDRTMLLMNGEVIETGTPDNVINTYHFLLARKSRGEDVRLEKKEKKTSYGNFKAEIMAVQFLNDKGMDSRIFTSGEKVKIIVRLKANDDIDRMAVGILIRDRFGQDIFGTNTHHLKKTASMKKGEMIEYIYSYNLNIGPGKYTLTSAVHRDETHVNESYHWVDNILEFQITGAEDYSFVGLSRLDVKVDIRDTR